MWGARPWGFRGRLRPFCIAGKYVMKQTVNQWWMILSPWKSISSMIPPCYYCLLALCMILNPTWVHVIMNSGTSLNWRVTNIGCGYCMCGSIHIREHSFISVYCGSAVMTAYGVTVPCIVPKILSLYCTIGFKFQICYVVLSKCFFQIIVMK